jgi:predicted nucleic acid-binding protein
VSFLQCVHLDSISKCNAIFSYKREFHLLKDSLDALPFLETTRHTWINAGRLSFDLRQKGITIPTTDLIIASLAIENHCAIYSLDSHFQKMPQVDLYTP